MRSGSTIQSSPAGSRLIRAIAIRYVSARIAGPEYDNAGMVRRRIGPHISEIQVQSDQYPAVHPRLARDNGILRSRQVFFGDSISFESGAL